MTQFKAQCFDGRRSDGTFREQILLFLKFVFAQNQLIGKC